MDIQAVKLVCFSPTGTSKVVLKAVAQGLGADNPELVDITLPEARGQSLSASADELLVLAVPVYSGRVPQLVCDWLEGAVLDTTPTACIVVYGNRAFEDALLELTDMVKARGGVPVAGAAFIGEHSFSGADAPIAVARPDESDLDKAREFGARLGQTMQSIASVGDAQDLAVPGNRPYRERTSWPLIDYIMAGDDCIQCGICARVCPVGAIDPEDSRKVDKEACIYCCACVKNCPTGSRAIQPSKLMDVAKMLSEKFQEPKEPEFFF